MYEYDTMEVNCEQFNTKGDLNRYTTTKSSEVLTVLVELYEMTYCSAPDGFYSEDEDFSDKVIRDVSSVKVAFYQKVRLVFLDLQISKKKYSKKLP